MLLEGFAPTKVGAMPSPLHQCYTISCTEFKRGAEAPKERMDA